MTKEEMSSTKESLPLFEFAAEQRIEIISATIKAGKEEFGEVLFTDLVNETAAEIYNFISTQFAPPSVTLIALQKLVDLGCRSGLPRPVAIKEFTVDEDGAIRWLQRS